MKDKKMGIRKSTHPELYKKAYERILKWRKKNPEKYKATQLRWKSRIQDYLKIWLKKHPGYAIKKARKYRYGVHENWFDETRKKQNNKCAICCKKFIKTPSVDHCHKTKKVRGLLCFRCNSMLGLSKENINTLKNAIKYLKTR
jgi:hypothetical protein